MIEKIFYNVIVFGTIISIFIFPLLIFLNHNKYKYNFKSIYKILAIVLLALFVPINTFNFSNIKNIFQKEKQISSEIVLEEPQIKFETEKIVIEVDENINVKNDTFFSIYQILPYIWAIGVMALLGYNILSYMRFLYKQKKNFLVEKNISIDNIIEKLCKQMHLKKVSYEISENISTPMTVGLFNKKIILSKEVLEDKQYEIILKHELFHIKNKDIEYKFLLLVLNCIYWFNPIIYMFTNQVDEVLELNCDENVLKGESQLYRLEYAKTLLNQIEKNRNEQYRLSMNFANRRKNIMQRFSNIVDKSKKRSVATIATVTAILLIVSALFIVLIPNINFATIQENIIGNTTNNETSPELKASESDFNNETNNTSTVNMVTEEEVNIISTVNNVADGKNNIKDEEITLETKNTETKQIVDENAINEEKEPILEEVKETYNKNNLENLFIEPLKNYVVTSRFGKSTYGDHIGIDLAAPSGTDIYAAASGKVVLSEWKGSYGYLIVIDHGNGVQTYYAQCSELLKNQNDEVKQGEVIAKVGSTGNSTGPHLHFEIRINGNAQNPQDYLFK